MAIRILFICVYFNLFIYLFILVEVVSHFQKLFNEFVLPSGVDSLSCKYQFGLRVAVLSIKQESAVICSHLEDSVPSVQFKFNTSAHNADKTEVSCFLSDFETLFFPPRHLLNQLHPCDTIDQALIPEQHVKCWISSWLLLHQSNNGQGSFIIMRPKLTWSILFVILFHSLLFIVCFFPCHTKEEQLQDA